MQENQIFAPNNGKSSDSHELAAAKKQGIIASALMMAVMAFEIVFPKQALSATTQIAVALVLLAILTATIVFYCKALRKISNLSGSNVSERFNKSLMLVFTGLVLYFAFRLADMDLVANLIIFAALIYASVIWFLIHYTLARLTKNRLFKIYATCTWLLVLLIIATMFLIYFFYLSHLQGLELVAAVSVVTFYAQIVVAFIVLALYTLLFFAWLNVESLSRAE